MSYKNQLNSRLKSISTGFFSVVQAIRVGLLKIPVTLISFARIVYSAFLKEIKLILSVSSQFVYRTFTRIVKFMYLVFDQVLGTIPTLIRANRILKAKILALEMEGISNSDPRMQLPVNHLNDYVKLEIERLDRIEEKAKSTVLGVGIAISLAAPSVLLPTRTATFVNEPLYSKLVLTVAIGLAVAFLLLSGYFALSAYKVGEISFPQVEYHPTLVSEDEIRKGLILLIDLNVLRIIQKANLLSASMDCLRNGLLLFFLVLLVSLLTIF